MRTVLCHGTFDIIHTGHVMHLEACKAYGDHLVVALSTDRMAAVRKVCGRPVIPYDQRKTVLEAIRYVDTVVMAPDPSNDLIANLMLLIQDLKPKVFVTSYDMFMKHHDILARQGTELIIREESPLNSSSQIMRKIQSIEQN